jgi:hypothetical protein
MAMSGLESCWYPRRRSFMPRHRRRAARPLFRGVASFVRTQKTAQTSRRSGRVCAEPLGTRTRRAPGATCMKTANRLRRRIEKAMARDLRRQEDHREETVINAFAFVMDMNRAILKTVSELIAEVEQLKATQRRANR